jgi:biotin carboxyl carrier protein
MSAHAVKSEIAGTVIEVCVAPGALVSEGDTLIILDSMTMEIPVIAERSGVVEAVLVEVGAPVSEGEAVINLQVK